MHRNPAWTKDAAHFSVDRLFIPYVLDDVRRKNNIERCISERNMPSVILLDLNQPVRIIVDCNVYPHDRSANRRQHLKLRAAATADFQKIFTRKQVAVAVKKPSDFLYAHSIVKILCSH